MAGESTPLGDEPASQAIDTVPIMRALRSAGVGLSGGLVTGAAAGLFIVVWWLLVPLIGGSGYGDFKAEDAMVVFVVAVFGATLWGCIIGTVCGLIVGILRIERLAPAIGAAVGALLSGAVPALLGPEMVGLKDRPMTIAGSALLIGSATGSVAWRAIRWHTARQPSQDLAQQA